MQAALDEERGGADLQHAVERFCIGDVLVHTWDLARAAGLDERLDPDEVHRQWLALGSIDLQSIRDDGTDGPRGRRARRRRRADPAPRRHRPAAVAPAGPARRQPRRGRVLRLASGLGDEVAVLLARLPGEPLEGSADGHGRHHATPLVAHRCRHRCHAFLALPHAGHPRALVTGQHSSGAPGRERQARPHRHDRAQLAGRLDRLDADAGIAVAHEELHALPRLRMEPGQGRAGRRPHGHRLRGFVTEADEAQPEAEATIVVTTDEPMRLQRHRQAVGRGPAQPRRPHQLRQRPRLGLDGRQHRHRLVEHADAA